MMSLFRSFYETACSRSTENSKKLKALTSLHVLSPEGLDINVSLLPRLGIELSMAGDTVCLKAELQNCGISYELETNITVIGTTLEDEYICIIDNEKWRIR